jgi:alpha-mannosidase
MNATAERLLTREAEPWSALASRRGASGVSLVAHAWRTLLGAHPHDTLCGCSIDEVPARWSSAFDRPGTRQWAFVTIRSPV